MRFLNVITQKRGGWTISSFISYNIDIIFIFDLFITAKYSMKLHNFFNYTRMSLVLRRKTLMENYDSSNYIC